MACIAVISLLIPPEDMDHVTCMICGNCPKIVNSDGNAKDTIKVTENMQYDYDDDGDPPDLETFKMDLIQATLRKSFYQKEPLKNYQMLKLPLIIAPSLLQQQTNNDIKENYIYLKFKSKHF